MCKRLMHNPQAVIGAVLILLLFLAAIFAPMFAPNEPNAIDLTKKFLKPCPDYPLGADELGRCELSRLLYGARYSLGISLPVTVFLALIGLFLGSASACAGEKVDHIITYICDVFISFPQLVIAIAVVGILGKGVTGLMISIIIAMWAWFTRIVRSYAVVEMGKDYILSAQLSGCGVCKLVIKHLIPNMMPQFAVYISTSVASSIIMISSFAFLGLGLSSDTPEWGAMLSNAKTALFSHPEMLIYPGVCIVVAAAGFNLLGEAIRDELSREGLV